MLFYFHPTRNLFGTGDFCLLIECLFFFFCGSRRLESLKHSRCGRFGSFGSTRSVWLRVRVGPMGSRWYKSRWWFETFFIFTPIWGRFPMWLTFFRWVETTNQKLIWVKVIWFDHEIILGMKVSSERWTQLSFVSGIHDPFMAAK